jgi:CheY-like chemotaxis protein
VSAEARTKPRVLVVDDEPPLRELMAVTLGDAFECLLAADGEEALQMLRDGAAPEVVFLDVMLPGVSGLDVLREMRADPRLKSIPVVVVSAWQTQEDVARAVEAGADHFLSKPFGVEEVGVIARTLTGGGA